MLRKLLDEALLVLSKKNKNIPNETIIISNSKENKTFN